MVEVGSVLKSNFYHKTTQQDGHYRENPSNHDLLTVRGGDCRALGASSRPTPGSLNVKLGPRRKGHKGRAVWLA